jgi:hypothetical protein
MSLKVSGPTYALQPWSNEVAGRLTSAGDEWEGVRRYHLAHGPQAPSSETVSGQNPHRAHHGLGTSSAIARLLEMLGYHQPRDSHVHS